MSTRRGIPEEGEEGGDDDDDGGGGGGIEEETAQASQVQHLSREGRENCLPRKNAHRSRERIQTLRTDVPHAQLPS